MPRAPRLIFDAHLDLAWSAVFFDRDLTLSVEEIRRRESHLTDHPARRTNTLSLPELRAAGVAVCVATLLARSGPEAKPRPVIPRTDLDYATPANAYAAAHAQLAWYRALEEQGHLRILRTRADLVGHWNEWQRAAKGWEGEAPAGPFGDPRVPRGSDGASPSRYEPRPAPPLGVILSMEGTDPILSPAQAREWYDQGLRAAGLAHYGRGRYAYGTATDGPLSDIGVDLLERMGEVGMILDVTHLSDTSMAQAFDAYAGPLLASHHNCRALVPGDRQLTDDQIRTIVARGGVIGAALDAWMLYPNWVRQQTKPEVVGLTAVADHIDHVCQLAGNTNHAALGTDLDGGFGFEQTPRDHNRYTDLHRLAETLATRNYSDQDVDRIFHQNWLDFFMRALPSR